MFQKLFIIMLFALCGVFAQETCKCPPSPDSTATISDSVFYFQNGKSVILCGSIDVDTRTTTFSAFIVRLCGQDSAIGFWSENKTCRVSVSRDTLNIESLVNLPVGREFGYLPVPLLTDKVYMAGDRIRRATRINPRVRKYTQSECGAIVKKYEATPKPIVDDLEDVMNRLFMAAISGNNKAYSHFQEFTTINPELDGDSQEQYNELSEAMGYFKRK